MLKMLELNKERANLIEVVEKFIKYKTIIQAIADTKEILNNEKDAEMIELAKMELSENEAAVEPIVKVIEKLL